MRPRCFFCQARDAKFLCGQCKKASYCDEKCQKQHWSTGHAETCVGDIIDYLPPSLEDCVARLQELPRVTRKTFANALSTIEPCYDQAVEIMNALPMRERYLLRHILPFGTLLTYEYEETERMGERYTELRVMKNYPAWQKSGFVYDVSRLQELTRLLLFGMAIVMSVGQEKDYTGSAKVYRRVELLMEIDRYAHLLSEQKKGETLSRILSALKKFSAYQDFLAKARLLN